MSTFSNGETPVMPAQPPRGQGRTGRVAPPRATDHKSHRERVAALGDRVRLVAARLQQLQQQRALPAPRPE